MNALRTRMSSLWPTFRPLGCIEKRFRALARAESGAAAMFFALSSPVWLGGLALGAEVGSWYYFEQKLQATADAVAVSIAGRVGTGASQSELDSLANDFLTKNQFRSSLGTATVTLSSPPGPVFVDGNTVNVELTRTVRRYLSGIFRPGEFVIRVTAAAQVNQATEGCVLASGITANGVNLGLSTDIQVNGCEVLSNGSGLTIPGGSRLTTDCVRSARSFVVNGSLTVACRNGEPHLQAGFTLDPYVNLPDFDLSMVPTCSTPAAVTISADSEWYAKITPSIVNGRNYARFCSGLDLTVRGPVAGTTITLPDWTFIFDGADFILFDRTHLNGPSVSFYFVTGGRPLIWAPNSRVTLTPNDPFGLLFRGARTNTFSFGTNNQIVVGPGSAMQGAIYFPASTVQFQAAGNLTGCPQIIGSALTLQGTWQLAGPCRFPGVLPIVASRDVNLTQ